MGIQNGQTALMEACLHKCTEKFLRLLIEKGADVNASDNVSLWTTDFLGFLLCTILRCCKEWRYRTDYLLSHWVQDWT